ncbi:hypothetical protein WKH56_19765 [Priestia sp. SB1]|uniref:hypothetical protein n=1 Tax=Priestia sp. SB1 TaxID=3132359 RepID=UPI0031750CED
MLIVFTIFFLTFYLVVLVKGGIARGLAIEIAKEDIKKQKRILKSKRKAQTTINRIKSWRLKCYYALFHLSV